MSDTQRLWNVDFTEVDTGKRCTRLGMSADAAEQACEQLRQEMARLGRPVAEVRAYRPDAWPPGLRKRRRAACSKRSSS